MILAGIEFTGKVGVGTIITIVVVTAGIVSLYWRQRQGDPSEWRENYVAEILKGDERDKRISDLEKALHEAEKTITELRASRDLTGLEERLTARMDAQLALIQSLVDRVAAS